MADKTSKDLTVNATGDMSSLSNKMNFFSLCAYAGAIIVSHFLKPKQPKPPKPSTDVENFMRVSEGSGISVVFGYAYIEDALGVFYRMVGTTKNYTGAPQVFASYNYYLFIQDVICLSNIDYLEYIYIGDIPVRGNWNENPSKPKYYGYSTNKYRQLCSKYIQLNSGGVTGWNYFQPLGKVADTYGFVSIEFGLPDQMPMEDLKFWQGRAEGITANDVPAYRGVVQCVWGANGTPIVVPDPMPEGWKPTPPYGYGVFIGEGVSVVPTPAHHAYLVSRFMKQHDGSLQWYSGLAHCGWGLNPIHIIRELAISGRIGGGISELKIDQASFVYSAQLLYDEGFGVNFHLNNTETSAREIVNRLLDLVTGFIRQNYQTGLIEIKLCRPDYYYEDLDELDEDDYIEIEGYMKKELDSATNQAIVLYRDRYDFETKTAMYKDDDSIEKYGLNSQEFDYRWIFNPDLASSLAQQRVVISTTQLTVCRMKGGRKFDKYNLGDVVRVSSKRKGFSGIVYRVVGKSVSGFNDGTITLNLLEDYFGIGKGAYGTGDNEVPVIPLPSVLNPYVCEAMYFVLWQKYGADPDNIIPVDRTKVVATSNATASLTGFITFEKQSIETDYNLDKYGNNFSKFATIKTALYVGEANTVIELNEKITVAVGSWACIDMELFYVYTAYAQFVGLTRGMHDTLPMYHSAGTPILFFEGFSTVRLFDKDFMLSEYNFKLASQSLQGGQDPAYAQTLTRTLIKRAILPYNVGKLRVNNSAMIALAYDYIRFNQVGLTDTTIIWQPRDRVTQKDLWLTQNADYATSESGVVYEIEFYNEATGVLFATATNFTSLGVLLTYNTEKQANGNQPMPIKRVHLWSRRLKQGSTTEYWESWKKWVFYIYRV